MSDDTGDVLSGMTLRERLRRLAAALPSDAAAITLTRADLVALLGDDGGGQERGSTPSRDVTVEEVAERVGRAASTVRGWLIAGDLRGYKLNGRDWRVPLAALREYLDAQRSDKSAAPQTTDGEAVDISAWRRLSS